MLKGKNVVIIKGEKGTAPTVTEYDRIYLEFGEGDPVESYTKTTDGKDLTLNGAVWQGVRPKNATSTAKVEDLMADALAYFKGEYPSANAYLTLLEAASYGSDLWKRNKIQSELRPSKPVDKQAAIAKMAKLLMAMNPKLTLAKATAAATAASESEEE